MNAGRQMCAALMILLGASSPSLASVLKPDDAATVAQGQKVYKAHCAACHGANLEGEANWRSRKDTGRMPAPPHDEKGHTWHHADKHLFELTKFGLKKFAGEDYESDMPAYEGTLDDDQIIAVLSYIKSVWPPQIREYHDALNKGQTE